jgi:hypothetical protein
VRQRAVAEAGRRSQAGTSSKWREKENVDQLSAFVEANEEEIERPLQYEFKATMERATAWKNYVKNGYGDRWCPVPFQSRLVLPKRWKTIFSLFL